MTDTRLLNFIREEMKRQGIVWKKEQELFEMLIPNEPWAKYKTNWSNWKHEKVHELTKSPHIRLAIGKTLSFSPKIWGASDLLQKEAVVKGVQKRFVNKSHVVPEWEGIIPSFELNSEQEELLETLRSKNLNEVEKALENYPKYFERTFDNQDFLLKLLDILYDKGVYELLVEKLFPSLLSHQRAKVRVKVMEAHALGSLKEPRYMESVKLLESIKANSDKKLIDLKTSMLSNLRRYHVENRDLSFQALKDGMEVMAKMYHELFVYTEAYHYYPAINLVYVLQVLNTVTEEKLDIDVKEVYKKAQASMKAEKALNRVSCDYYASMTEFEFLLLLGHKNVDKKIASMLEQQKPSVALVQRTKRQMLEFVKMVERVNAPLVELVEAFQKVIMLLKDYEREQKHEL